MKNIYNPQHNKYQMKTQKYHIRVTCTVCGCTESMFNIFKMNTKKQKLVKGCYNCDPVTKGGE